MTFTVFNTNGTLLRRGRIISYVSASVFRSGRSLFWLTLCVTSKVEVTNYIKPRCNDRLQGKWLNYSMATDEASCPKFVTATGLQNRFAQRVF